MTHPERAVIVSIHDFNTWELCHFLVDLFGTTEEVLATSFLMKFIQNKLLDYHYTRGHGCSYDSNEFNGSRFTEHLYENRRESLKC